MIKTLTLVLAANVASIFVYAPTTAMATEVTVGCFFRSTDGDHKSYGVFYLDDQAKTMRTPQGIAMAASVYNPDQVIAHGENGVDFKLDRYTGVVEFTMPGASVAMIGSCRPDDTVSRK